MAETTATPSAPAAITAAALSTVMPPIATRGRLTAARIRLNALQPEGRSRIFFGGCRKHRTDADIIGTLHLRPHAHRPAIRRKYR